MNKTHGMHNSRTYKIWAAMKSRCQDPNNAHYFEYGARGIQVCLEWQTFEGFLEQMGEAPDDLTIERIDVNGPYNLTNCRWASRKEQARNRRSNRHLNINGVSKPCSEWAEIAGISRHLLYIRLKRGWNPEDAVFAPSKGKNHNE